MSCIPALISDHPAPLGVTSTVYCRLGKAPSFLSRKLEALVGPAFVKIRGGNNKNSQKIVPKLVRNRIIRKGSYIKDFQQLIYK